MADTCSKHDDLSDRVTALEQTISVLETTLKSTIREQEKQGDEIRSLIKLENILVEVKNDIKYINKKLDKKSLEDIIVQTVFPAAIIGGIVALAIIRWG